MPKKTKKEKIIADYRRKLATTYSLPKTTESFSAFNQLASHANHSFHLPTSPLPHQPKQDEINQSQLAAIKSDLVKTMALAIVAIAIEFLLYWQDTYGLVPKKTLFSF